MFTYAYNNKFSFDFGVFVIFFSFRETENLKWNISFWYSLNVLLLNMTRAKKKKIIIEHHWNYNVDAFPNWIKYEMKETKLLWHTHTLPKVCLISDLFFLHFSLLIYLFITNRFDLAFWCGDLHTNTPKLQASAAVTYRLFVFVFSIFDVCFEFHLYSIRLRICFLQRYQLQMSEPVRTQMLSNNRTCKCWCK